MDGLDIAVAAARRTVLLREKLELSHGLPAGCKGAACPAFALCQGRCAVRLDGLADETSRGQQAVELAA